MTKSRCHAPGLSWAQIGRDHILRRGDQELARLVHIGLVSGCERWRVQYAGAKSSPLALVARHSDFDRLGPGSE